jgi:septal ring-binding cell division protein DamX
MRPTPAPTPVPATPTPRPPAAATPPATRATTSPAPATATADARSLLGQGSFPQAARAFAASLATGSRSRFSLQLLTACSPETVQKAVGAAGGADHLFILPISLQGRACYRLCWGVYETRPAAEAAVAGVPAYFRQGGTRPRLSALSELLP